jgi:phosphonate transport system ATP-binding protein
MDLRLAGAGHVHANGHRALGPGLAFAVPRGERVAVIGPSGAGKTTLVRILGTALRPSEGTLALGGTDPWTLGGQALRTLRARIGTVHQAPPLPPRLRVVHAVLAGRLGTWSVAKAIASLAVPADAAGARDALAPLGLADRLWDRCDRLSGGQAQRVGIARVLYQRPDLILADEPVSALDPTLADRALAALVAAQEETGATLVASLHAVDLALRWFPRTVALRDGAVAFDLPSREVTPALLRALYAGEAPTSADVPPATEAANDATLGFGAGREGA